MLSRKVFLYKVRDAMGEQELPLLEPHGSKARKVDKVRLAMILPISMQRFP